jgi:hypothetical protein
MKNSLKLITLFSAFIIFGCGSEEKKPTIGDKIDKKMDRIGDDIKKVGEKVEEKAEEINDKTKAKAKEIEKKVGPSNKKSAPVEVAFDLKDNLLNVSINLNKSVSNLKVQATPLDGLQIEKPSTLDKDAYDVPTSLSLPVQLKNQVGRLAIYVSGTFDGRQLAHSQTYDFPKDPKSSKKDPVIEKDGNGDPIRVMPAKEK